MNKKRKELVVSAIENGTVIDHIPTEKIFQVVRILGLEGSQNPISLGKNLQSKKYGKKGILKISNRFFKNEEINKIALVAPTATLIEIRDFEVTSKKNVEIPQTVNRIVKCINPNCITNKQDVPTMFRVIVDHHGEQKLACNYCEKTTSMNNLNFI